jgi:TRAP-type C4-dicarboxylate transport system permease small subunit
MNAIKMAAIALILAGVLAMAVGGFTYIKDTHEIKIGTIELSLNQTQTVNIPLWLGLGAIGLGGLILLLAGNKK